MSTVLISLVGGRPLPTILLAQHIQPDTHYLIVSRDSVGAGRDLEKTLAALPADYAPKDSFIVAPYALQETIDACETIIVQHPHGQFLINATLGPKTMAFGAYDAAKEYRKQGSNIEVCYLARDQLVNLFSNTIERVKIDLKTYCASYGWAGAWKQDAADPRLPRLAELFSRDIFCTNALLRSIRGPSQGKGKRTCRTQRVLAAAEFELLKAIEAIGLLSNVQHEAQGTSWTIVDHGAGELLIGGDWLEYMVYTYANGLTAKPNTQLFNELGWGLEDAHGKGEIDFVGLYQSQLIVASCKSKPDIERTWFEELRSKMDQLGKGMCSGLLISTVSRASRSAKDLADYERWAQNNQVVLILAEDIPNLSAILTKVTFADSQLAPQDLRIYPRI